MRGESVPKHAHRAGTSLEAFVPHEEAGSGSVPGGARRSSRRAVGFTLSLDSTPVTPMFMRSGIASRAVLPSWLMPDGAKLFIVGTVLFGLAAAVRKAS